MDTITRKPIDLESWARSRRNRRSFGPGMMPPPRPDPGGRLRVRHHPPTDLHLHEGEPVYTFTKVNPAWVATVHSRMEPSAPGTVTRVPQM